MERLHLRKRVPQLKPLVLLERFTKQTSDHISLRERAYGTVVQTRVPGLGLSESSSNSKRFWF